MPGSIMPGTAASQPTSGWEVDQQTQKFTFIIQIPPNAIEDFAQGPAGNELPVPIEDRLVGRVEQIAIRFDTKELPRIDPPNVNSRSQASAQPSIQNLALMRYAPQSLSGPNQWESMVGWQFDNKTSRYSYLIQIPVANLQQFITPPFGREMIVPIHPEARDFVEQVTVRIGNGALPKELAPASVLAKYQYTPGDNLRNLAGNDLGLPMKSIDPTPVSGGPDLGQQRGPQTPVLPNIPSNLGSFANGSDAGFNRPSGPGSLINNQPSFGGSNAAGFNNNNNNNNMNNGTAAPPGYRSPLNNEVPSLDVAQRASQSDLQPVPQNRITNNLFGRPDTMQTNPGMDRFAGNPNNRIQPGGQGAASGQMERPFVNTMPQYASPTNNAYQPIASNPMPQYTPTSFSNFPTSAATGNIPNNQINPVSSNGGALLQNGAAGNLNQQLPTDALDKKPFGFNWAFAALVLLGFNIYQFFWMSNARIKYRQMVLSKRSTRLEPTA
ncbi:MAG: hypothetical protein MUC43_17105 [Pirellula sp.]|nr:hypothetical protein [Pirellula sp.]